jgi:hypothetical protein
MVESQTPSMHETASYNGLLKRANEKTEAPIDLQAKAAIVDTLGTRY